MTKSTRVKVAGFTMRYKTILTVAYFAVIFLVYAVFNFQFLGPVFLSDEIGYLNKAATLAGYQIDASSSFYAGYSLLVAPIFFFVSEPRSIWVAVVILNAALMTGSLAILFNVLRSLFPNKGHWQIMLAVFICALYPSWIVWVGHAFTTCAFVFFYMLTIWTILRVDYTKRNTLVAPSVLCGYLYWIHPIGIAVSAAWLLTLIIVYKKKQYGNLLMAFGIFIGMFFLYQYGLNNWLTSKTNLDIFTSTDHYSLIGVGLPKILSLHFFAKTSAMIIGQFAAVLIATFGVSLFVLIYAIKSFRRTLKQPGSVKRRLSLKETTLFLSIAMIGVIVLGSVNFYLAQVTIMPEPRTDFWIYGRYASMTLLPVIGVGFLLNWQRHYMYIASASVFLVGLLLWAVGVSNGAFHNQINTVAFWPQYLSQSTNFLIWFGFGALGILYASFLKKSQLLLLLLPVFILASAQQAKFFHNLINKPEGHPTGMISLIRHELPKNECIGYEGQAQAGNYIYSKEDLYRFYLYDYNFSKMTPKEWKHGACSVYLGRNLDSFQSDKNVKIVGREEDSGLYLVIKKDLGIFSKTQNKALIEFYFNPTMGGKCVISGCFDRTAEELMGATIVGKYKNSVLSASGKPGFVFYGPSLPLATGEYKLVLYANVEDSSEAQIEILDGSEEKNSTYFSSFKVKKAPQDKYIIPFSLKKDIKTLQIRLLVLGKGKVDVKYYEIISK